MKATIESDFTDLNTGIQGLVGLPPQELQNEISLRRMDTIKTLLRGNIYLIRTALSHLSGKSDSLIIQIERGEYSHSDVKLLQWLESSRNSVDQITNIVSEIERSNMLGSTELKGEISAQEISEILGSTMKGYLKTIRDTRSVNLSVESGEFSGLDFPVPFTTLIDQIAPVLLEILSEAVMDGKILLSSVNNGTDKFFVISFQPDLIGRLELTEVLQKGFGNLAGVEKGEVRKIDLGNELIARYNQDSNLNSIELIIGR